MARNVCRKVRICSSRACLWASKFWTFVSVAVWLLSSVVFNAARYRRFSIKPNTSSFGVGTGWAYIISRPAWLNGLIGEMRYGFEL